MEYLADVHFLLVTNLSPDHSSLFRYVTYWKREMMYQFRVSIYIAVSNSRTRIAGGILWYTGCSTRDAAHRRRFCFRFGSLFSKLTQFSKKNIHFRNIIRDSACGVCRIMSELDSSALWNVDFKLMFVLKPISFSVEVIPQQRAVIAVNTVYWNNKLNLFTRHINTIVIPTLKHIKIN